MINQPPATVSLPAKPPTPTGPVPNDRGVIVVQAHFKIFDPATGKVFVKGRA